MKLRTHCELDCLFTRNISMVDNLRHWHDLQDCCSTFFLSHGHWFYGLFLQLCALQTELWFEYHLGMYYKSRGGLRGRKKHKTRGRCLWVKQEQCKYKKRGPWTSCMCQFLLFVSSGVAVRVQKGTMRLTGWERAQKSENRKGHFLNSVPFRVCICVCDAFLSLIINSLQGQFSIYLLHCQDS